MEQSQTFLDEVEVVLSLCPLVLMQHHIINGVAVGVCGFSAVTLQGGIDLIWQTEHVLLFKELTLFLQMIHAIKTLIENADNVYEKIVQCQKAGKDYCKMKINVSKLCRDPYCVHKGY